MSTLRLAQRDLPNAVKHGIPAQFDDVEGYGSMSATRRGYWVGYLPEQLSSIFRTRNRALDVTIYSYGTPIAWRDRGVWVLPDVSYLVTTSKHQSYCWGLDYVRIPWDCDLALYERILAGKTIYRDGRTYPGPNYVTGE